MEIYEKIDGASIAVETTVNDQWKRSDYIL